MKIRLYNHHYLPDDGSWVYIFMDQMKQLEDFGLMDAIAVPQTECFEAAVLFARTEGIVPALLQLGARPTRDFR